MKRTLLSFAALSLCTLAVAGGHGYPQTPQQGGTTNTNTPIAVGVGVGGSSTSNAAALSQSRSNARANARANNRNTVKVTPTQNTTVNLTLPETKAQAPIVLETVKEATTKEPTAAAEKAELPVVVPQYDSRPVSTAFAPSISPTSPCALTVSGGFQVKELGMSFGGTPIAEFCKNLEIARAAYNMQDTPTAEEIMCGEDAYRKARVRAKRPCAEDLDATSKKVEAILNDQVATARVEPLLP